MHVLAPMKFRLAYLLLLLFAFSCGRGNPALRSAERVIEDHPDSALYILDGISRVDLASEREKAEYDFLSAEAFYRTYYFLDDASEASLERACLYFEANGPAVERMRAWELMGTIQTAVGPRAPRRGRPGDAGTLFLGPEDPDGTPPGGKAGRERTLPVRRGGPAVQTLRPQGGPPADGRDRHPGPPVRAVLCL